MSDINFADIYQSAHFTIEPAKMPLRQTSLAAFLEEVDFNECVGAAKLYFGIKDDSFQERLLEIVRKDDPSFSLVENAREATVIATGFVASLIGQGDVETCLSLSAGSLGGLRQGTFRPDLVVAAKKKLIELTVNSRATEGMGLPTKFKSRATAAKVDEWKAGQDVEKLSALLKQLSADDEASSVLAYNSAINLRTAVRNVREDLDLYWWHVGGYSVFHEKPYSEFSAHAIPVLAASEVASLVKSQTGPAAVASLLHLRLTAANAPDEIAFQEAVEAAAPHIGNVDFKHEGLAELCPLHFALSLHKSSPVGWRVAFEEKAGVAASTRLKSIDVAMQIYREANLIRLAPSE